MVVSSLAFALLGWVGNVPFVRAVRGASQIVVGWVERVVFVEGHRFADVRVERTLKGRSISTVRFLAESTWACDVSDAVPGEVGTFLLYDIAKHRPWIDGSLTRSDAIHRAEETAPVYSLGGAGDGRIVESREELPGKLGNTWYYGRFIMPHAVPPQLDASSKPFYSRDRLAYAVAFCLRDVRGKPS